MILCASALNVTYTKHVSHGISYSVGGYTDVKETSKMQNAGRANCVVK